MASWIDPGHRWERLTRAARSDRTDRTGPHYAGRVPLPPQPAGGGRDGPDCTSDTRPLVPGKHPAPGGARRHLPQGPLSAAPRPCRAMPLNRCRKWHREDTVNALTGAPRSCSCGCHRPIWHRGLTFLEYPPKATLKHRLRPQNVSKPQITHGPSTLQHC